MSTLVDELRRSFDDQVAALEEEIDARFGRLEPSKTGARGALEILRAYPSTVRKSLARHWRRDPDLADKLDAAREHLAHVEAVWAIFEQWFGRGSATGFPRSLARAVDDELRLCGSSRRAVLAVGPPGELETWIPDLYDQVFGGLAANPSASLRRQRFAMIQVPRLQGAQALWRPLILGHELMHLLLEDRRRKLPNVDIVAYVGHENDARVRVPNSVREFHGLPDNVFESVGRSWFEELLCDAYALRRFGPSAIAALSSFFDTGSDEDYTEHPPASLRLQVLLDVLEPLASEVGDDRRIRLMAMLEPAAERASPFDRSWPRWVQVLARRILPLAHEIPAMLSRWPIAYDWNSRAEHVVWVADRLKNGIPSDEFSSGELLSAADILNGAWLAWSEGGPAPVDRLALKSLETVEFDELWSSAAAVIPRTPRDKKSPEWKVVASVAGVPFGGILPRQEIIQRLDEVPGRIHVVPRPRDIAGTAMDLRLGNRFIVFEPSGIAAFDPVDPATDPRVIQGSVDKDWGEPFVLHPGDLVLAAAHEYIALPGDVSCLLITRSSYGRLGLVTATAVLVHPYFHGCLTLELVNLGSVPLVLTPGERIAQLIFMRVHDPVKPPDSREKYRCPTGPEFSKIRADPDARVIAEIRRRRLSGAVQ